ncbi:hypothetical protein CMV24_19140 [Pseudomonas plecoglossicida]|jgi:hypothetical protein|uniref:Uncharacterized protein n=2 Tax=Pseudomonas TaxID=286 RepID=A0A2A3M1J7_PSEDL|nr:MULTISPECIES: hypothetical protein [Pseudomonas]TXG99412.1 MAG: hypothetical protein E6R08_02160 [Nevskiaceae bacterium]HBO8767491.1 hypothetical protein [Pseudomonas aeruginosa]EKT4481235.1 hypothetical protein [Pseudomonas putida]MBA6061950.1 hypothetical protein [Pseudomonas juntendi]PBJ93938.1 hypothetical protein CMV24_19140 [Pseudomonas plecoglossicida]
MDKSEMSRLLELQVQEKLRDGYSITTYAMDAAGRDRVRCGIKTKGHSLPNENHAAEDWQEYIGKLETGAYKSVVRTKVIETGDSPNIDQSAGGSGTVGLWKARRH